MTKRAGARMKERPFDYLSEDIITQILLCLPVKPVIRAGAVCKLWRQITTNESFIAEHVRLRPPNVVLYTSMAAEPRGSHRAGDGEMAISLDVIPISSGSDDEMFPRPLIRYPKRGDLLLLASCNGVLLFLKSRTGGRFLLHNPLTKQWAELPQLDGSFDERAFYFHEPSGEFRLLCQGSHHQSPWLILSTGSAEPRELEMHPQTAIDVDIMTMGIKTLLTTTPVPLDGRLHWLPCEAAATGASEVVVFNTLSETFGVIAGPPTTTADMTKLFAMEGKLAAADFGKLGAADFGKAEAFIDLWFLEDYDAGRWERRHRVPTPWRHVVYSGRPCTPVHMCTLAAAADDSQGNVMLGNHKGLVVYSLRTKTVTKVNSVMESKKDVVVSRHTFRDSMAPHPSFAARSASEMGLSIFWS